MTRPAVCSSGLGRQRASRYEELSGSLNNVKHADTISASHRNKKVSNSIKDIQGMLNSSSGSGSSNKNSVSQDPRPSKFRGGVMRPPMELPVEASTAVVSEGTDDPHQRAGSCGEEGSSSISGDTLSCSGSEVSCTPSTKSANVNDLHLNLGSSASNSPKPDFVARIQLDPSCKFAYLV